METAAKNSGSAKNIELRTSVKKPGLLDRISTLWVDRLTIVAILAVVVTVSVPTLRGVARRENENDARVTLALLSKRVAMNPSNPTDLATLVRQDDSLLLRLHDIEILRGDRPLLRRHGYLFEAVRAESGKNVGQVVLRAWPWHAGESGSAVFACISGSPPLGFSNADARFSGPFSPPPATLNLPLAATTTSEVLAAPPR